MTATQEKIVSWALTAIAAAAGAGVVWGTAQAQLGGKLDAGRFERDSTRRDVQSAAQAVRIEETLRRIEGSVDEANGRLREIACPPTTSAPGCR